MVKSKRSTDDQAPSSLYHYTSTEVLLKLFNNIIEENTSYGDVSLNFHASESTCMNDTRENGIIKKNLNLVSKNLISEFEQIKEKLDKVYIISFSKYNEKIPMWKMYGQDGYGINLKFDYRDLKTHFNLVKENKIDELSFNQKAKYLIKCCYSTKTEIEEKSRELRNHFKQHKDSETVLIASFNKYQLKTISYKHESFFYEDEYRIVTFSKESKFKYGRYGITEYNEVKIPLSALKCITTGPLCSESDIEKIKLLCKKIKNKSGIEIKVNKSNLSIR